MKTFLRWEVLFFLFCILRSEAAFNTIPKVPTFSLEETIEQWKDMEKKLIDAGDSITKQVMPMILRSSSELDLTPDCQADILKVILALRQFKMWAVRLVDAMGRPKAGMVSGTLSAHGAYDQCLDLEVRSEYQPDKVHFRGQYCSVDFRPPLPEKPKRVFKGLLPPLGNITFKTEFMKYFANEAYNYYHISMRMGYCSPSTCTRNDVQQIIEYLAVTLGQHATVVHCEVKESKQLDNVQLAIVLVLGLFGTLVGAATLAEVLRNFWLTPQKKASWLWNLVDSFSAVSCTRRIFSSSENEDHTLSCLNGVRFFSITWVVLCHTYLFLDPVMFRNGLQVHEFAASFPLQVVNNASLAVDSFFFMTGVLMSYQLVKMFDMKGQRCINFPIIFVRRILRLLPSAMLAVGLMILLPTLGSGPTWYEEVELNAQACRKLWWYIPLFINNFPNPFEACLMHTWYISVDLQLLMVAIIFFVIYFRAPRWGYLFVGLSVVASIVAASMVTWYLDLFPAVLETSPDKVGTQNFVRNTYIMPYPHIGCYFLGILLGIFLERKKKFSLPVIVQVLGWPLAVVCNCAVIFATWPWNSGRYPTQVESWTYAGFHRTAWGLGMAWMTLMCATGRGGFLNGFLSWSGYTVLNRLTYLVYLLHYLVIAYYLGNLRDIVDVNHPFLVWLFFGNLVTSFIVAYIFRVLVEGPLTEIEKKFFQWLQQRSQSPHKEVQNGVQSISLNGNHNGIHKGVMENEERKINDFHNGVHVDDTLQDVSRL